VRLLSLFIVAVLSLVACAHPHDAVCDITNERSEIVDGRRAWPGGSGTLVSSDGFILSCGHLFENGGRSAKLSFKSVKGQWRARVVDVDFRNDLSLLKISNPPKLDIPRVCAASRADGPFDAVGFPGDLQGEIEWSRGNFIRLTPSSRVETRCQVRSGYSGGALFNRHGEVCGVVCGMTGPNENQMDRCYAPSGDALLNFVGRYIEVQK
jgi:S1-C subfamily serine protease